ncbi:exported hypothetical protein [Candidatus Terasakiella magnetica]|uniref:Uncharacterized protein n=1 Tax=Candidatus Terasakiella magnetica TaxID=1867952 RepID=A0A1C3RLX5_9PROT|nr:transporter substrate-binding domain-containing protein [Candidatus Terasakiella magnetica]SCA58291.1 exported hypothetical protein [Candidatus Terasakiella magnetica]
MHKFTLAVLVGVFTIGFCDAQAQTLKLARQPVSHISDLAQEKIECSLKKMEQPYEIIMVPWKRAQQGTQYNKYHGFFVATQTKARDAYAVRSHGVLSNNWLFIQKNKTPTPNDQNEFWSQSFTANIGTAKLRWLKSHQDDGKIKGRIIEAPTMEGAMYHLITGHSQVLVENQINYDRLVKKNKAAETFTTYIAREVSQGVYFSKAFLAKNTAFLDKFNSALKQCLTKKPL